MWWTGWGKEHMDMMVVLWVADALHESARTIHMLVALSG